MKIQTKWIWSSGLALASLTFSVAGQEDTVIPITPLLAQANPASHNLAAGTTESSPQPALPATTTPAEDKNSAPLRVDPSQKPERQPEPPSTERVSVVPAPKEGKRPAPELAPLSAGLKEIIKLSQAGISEGVILSYITNSTNVYNVTSDEIIYLNDLGISSTIITALIEKDHAPEAEARKREAFAVAPLPAEATLTEPATNIYPATTPKSQMVQVPEYPAAETDQFTQADLEAPAPPQPVAVYQPAAAEPLPSAISDYYSAMTPYGTWYEVPEYGYCWQPTVAVINYRWRPYADHGRWLWTSHGWYWYSYYTWGWAPFHYGRWCTYPALGWIWVPDNVWGPSWVSWRYTKYYCGWAPLPPRTHYVSGFGLYYDHCSVGLHFDFGLSYHHYTFVPLNRFCDERPHYYFASHAETQTIYRDSQVVNNYVVGDNNAIINQGIGLDPVARVSRTQIPTVRVRDDWQSTSPGERRERLVTDNSEPVVFRPPPPSQSATGSRWREQYRHDGAGLPTGSAAGPQLQDFEPGTRPASIPVRPAPVMQPPTQAGTAQVAPISSSVRSPVISSSVRAVPAGQISAPSGVALRER